MHSTCKPVEGLVCLVKLTHFSQIPGDFSTGETFCETMFAYLTNFEYAGRLPATGILQGGVPTCLTCLGRSSRT